MDKLTCVQLCITIQHSISHKINKISGILFRLFIVGAPLPKYLGGPRLENAGIYGGLKI